MRYTRTQIEEIARNFWGKAALAGFLPYDLFEAAGHVLPVEIIRVPGLSLLKIREWLKANDLYDVVESRDINDRILHGFILPLRGSGLVFVNANDPEAEQRFTVAHEISHFLMDHELPRQRAISELGDGILEVLDGDVSAGLSDQVTAAIRGVNIFEHMHFIEKDGDGSFRSWASFTAENDADSLALELLAPRNKVIQDALSENTNLSYPVFFDRCRVILLQSYLLPYETARQYAAELACSVTGGSSVLDKLGL